MQDSWASGDPYERFMGRWSGLVADEFLTWLDPLPRQRWLDVGCGSGALSEAILLRSDPMALTALDQSPAFVATAAQRLPSLAACRVGSALALPFPDQALDIIVSGLVLNFIDDPLQALAEMTRVADHDGAVAVYVWDYAGRMEFLQSFWAAVVALDPSAMHLDEALRFPDANPETVTTLFEKAGLVDVGSAGLEIATTFVDFDDYWQPFLGGQGPAPTYVAALNDAGRATLRESIRANLPIQPDGSIPLRARAWAVRGTKK